MNKTSISRTRYISCTAVMSAIATILMYLEISIPIMPSFLKLDFSELPALICSFALGPTSGIIVCLVKNLLHLFSTTTGGIGEMSNFILGIMLVVPAGYIYKYKKTRVGALSGALVGSIVSAFAGVVTNYYIVYPLFAKLLIPMEVILGMYQAIYSGADNLWKSLLIFNLPFTFIKGIVISIIAFLVYKPLSRIIKGYECHTPNRNKPNNDTTIDP